MDRNRRGFLKAAGIALPAAAAIGRLSAASADKKQLVKIVEFDASGVRKGVVEVEKVEKSEAEWKKQLSAEQFQITRQAGTEFPGTGKYANNHADGLYTIASAATQFSSIPKPNSSQALAGPVSGSPSRRKT